MGPSGGRDDLTTGLIVGFASTPPFAPAPVVVPFRANVAPGFSQPVNTPYIIDVVCDGSTIASYLNGTVQQQLGSSGNFGIGRYRIGTQFNSDTSTKYTGYVSEVLIFNAALTITQRQEIEGYLAWKWGLQGSLSSTNQYSTVASPPATAPPVQ
jgi:hypothetical protein